MSFQLIDEPVPSTSGQTEPVIVDWKKCFLCQAVTREPVQCPASSKRKDKGAGYKYMAENIKKFHEMNQLPFSVNVEQLDEGQGMEETFLLHNAVVHKSCRAKINTRMLERAVKCKCETEDTANPVKTKQHFVSTDDSEPVCFFCDEKGGSSGLHRASTFKLDYKVRRIATDLSDTKVLSKLAAGDMVAIKAQYHTLCLAKFYKRAKQYERNQDNDLNLNESSAMHGIAFAELISYIESYRESPETCSVLKLQDLKKLYLDRIEKLGAESGQLHTTRFKERILAAVPDLQSQNKGKEVLLTFTKDIGPALKHACDADYDIEGMLLAKVANIVRRDIFKIKQIFNGQFTDNCQQKSVPTTLTSLISMILNGPNIKDQLELEGIDSQASLTISQLVALTQ